MGKVYSDHERYEDAIAEAIARFRKSNGNFDVWVHQRKNNGRFFTSTAASVPGCDPMGCSAHRGEYCDAEGTVIYRGGQPLSAEEQTPISSEERTSSWHI